jgi:hypothetical protein
MTPFMSFLYTDPTGHIKIGKFFKHLFHKADQFFYPEHLGAGARMGFFASPDGR